MAVRLTRANWITAGVFYGICQILFLINIQFPKGHNFDEFHYVPSAKQFLAMTENQNWEHPPLGKILMAVGIQLWGDQPIGWRFMSTIFGSLTLVGMYILALVLFESEQAAIWVALLTLVNQLLYVQARIGMLDTFMFAFLVWAMAAYCATWKSSFTPRENRRLLNFTGVMFGLGMACKWFVVVPWMGCVALVLVIRLLQRWKTTFGSPRATDWYRPDQWSKLNWKDWVIRLGLFPLGVYFLTFVPYFFVSGSHHSLSDLITMQIKMFDGQLRVVHSHPYMSHWLDWPLLKRPIWYAFDKEGAGPTWVRGVLLLGNPVIMWTGLLALGVCAWNWVKTRDQVGFLILFFYLIYFGCWAVIPRKIAFYYYYYPAGMVLSLALAYAFRFFEAKKIFKDQVPRWVFLGVAFGMFVYFFPILAALRIPADSFRQWMWFSSWI
jgi:dolichyl-phosphate-mannose--protein O-mannosyl transferase